jgi:hypothetical protein
MPKDKRHKKRRTSVARKEQIAPKEIMPYGTAKLHSGLLRKWCYVSKSNEAGADKEKYGEREKGKRNTTRMCKRETGNKYNKERGTVDEQHIDIERRRVRKNEVINRIARVPICKVPCEQRSDNTPHKYKQGECGCQSVILVFPLIPVATRELAVWFGVAM